MGAIDPNLAAHVAQLKPGQHVVAEWYGDDTSIGVVSENRINADADSYLVLSDRVLRHSDGSPPSDLARIIFPTYIPDPQPTPTGPTLPTEEEWNAEFGRLMPAQDRPGDFDRGWTAAQNWIQERTRGGVLIGPQSAEDVDRVAEAALRLRAEVPPDAVFTPDQVALARFRSAVLAVYDHLGIQQAPTQPDEPTGLGAVVEVKGERWVRNDRGDWHASEQGARWEYLLFLGPVTVLHEGWSE